jgi:hypothetical protein
VVLQGDGFGQGPHTRAFMPVTPLACAPMP